MNKLKRGLQLGGAIASISFCSILLLLSLIALPATISLLSAIGSYGVDTSVILSLVTVILMMLLCIAIIIVSCMLLPNQDKKPLKTNFKICLTDIIIIGCFLILCIVTISILEMIIMVACMTLLIVSLCVGKKDNQVINDNFTQNQQNNNANTQTNNANDGVNNNFQSATMYYDLDNIVDRKIFRIRQLYSEGIINES